MYTLYIYIHYIYIYVIYIYLYLLTFGHKNQPKLCINSYTKIHLFSCLRKPLEKAVNWGNLHASVAVWIWQIEKTHSLDGWLWFFGGGWCFLMHLLQGCWMLLLYHLGGPSIFEVGCFGKSYIFKLGTWDPSERNVVQIGWGLKNLLKSMRWKGIHEANWNSWDHFSASSSSILEMYRLED